MAYWSVEVVVVLVVGCAVSSLAEITVNCDAVCNQVESMHGEEENECNVVCRNEQCHTGCLDWREATRSSCRQTCTSHGWPSEDTMFCTMGCVYAAQTFLRQVEEVITTPAAPQLIARSVSESSVGLRWNTVPEVDEVRYLVQYHQTTVPGEWVYYRPDQPLNTTQVFVQDLNPYTKYQFRIAWLVLPHHAPIMSEASSWISTLASGPPRSPPRELKAVPLDWSRVEVTWEPPLFPGGDLISYTLYSKDTQRQEMRANINANEERRYILAELSANTTYLLNLTSTNHRGEGPAVVVKVTTYPNSPAVDDGQGYLLLTSGPSLLKLGLDIADTPTLICNTSGGHNIIGMAAHIPLGIIYISDTSGSIYQMRISPVQQRILLTQSQIHGYPLSLSVDWLYGYLYYIVHLEPPGDHTWQLWRCDLMGKNPVLIYGGLHYEAKYLQVDPYNGYIWWISEDLDKGLHRLNLNDEFVEGEEPMVVLRSSDLAGLVLDPPNFQVLIADRKNNTMLAVSLDGTSVTNLRNNTQQAFFKHLCSVVHLNSRFIWTDGGEVWTEELNGETFYHISYLDVSKFNFGTLVAVHASTQPVPVPLNPPSELQAVFTRKSASLTWNAPTLPALMGSGAWQKWLYEMHIQEGQKIIYRKNICDTSHQATNLRPGTFYIIKVRAYSIGGNGPWSHEFRGRTLDDTDLAPKLIWAIDKKIIFTNLAGSESSVLISQETLKTKLDDGKIADLAFFHDSLVMAVSNRSVFVMNITTSTFNELPNTHGVLSVSVDWLTQRLFWANPHRQMIGWTNLNGSSQGPLNVVTAAREVRVDALRGRLFWTTPHALLMSTLAGRNVTTVHQEGIFSGKQVYGLTVDSQGSRIWWIVRDADGCRLFGALVGDTLRKFPSKLLPNTVEVGPMWYVSERLLWLGDDGDVVVSDTNLNNSAALHTSNLGVSHFIVMLPNLHPVPDGVKMPVVIPEQIDAKSLLVKGTWTNFSLVWKPITNVNYGSLMYEVIIDNGNIKQAFLTNETTIVYEEILPPYSTLKVSIRGITNWNSGARLLKTLRTPAHLPEAPQDLRTFVHKIQDSNAMINLRWSPPDKPNGEIINYEIIYCTINDEEKCISKMVNGTMNQLTVENLNADQVYGFKVAAVTEMGKGSYSHEVTGSLQQHVPTPSLLVVSDRSLIKLDADLQEEAEVLSENSRVQWATPLLKNSSFAWMDVNSDIYLTDMKTNFTEKLLRLSGRGVGLAVDWIGEVIVWAEAPPEGSSEIKIQTLIIGQKSGKFVTSMNITGHIKKFLLSPLTSQLLVLHEGHRGLQLLNTSLSANTLQNFFREERSSECNCMTTPTLGGAIALDASNISDVSLYFVASEQTPDVLRASTVYKADLSGCSCEAIFVPEEYGYGTCNEIAVDYGHLYCYTASNQTLLWLPKKGITLTEDLHSQPLHNATSLIPVDLATQPMPEPECLVPSNYSEAPTLAGSRETTIAIKLVAPESKENECRSITSPPVTYILYYAPVSHNESISCSTDITHCHHVRRMENVITVNGLQPYTRYVFRSAVETVYNKRLGIKSVAGPVAIYKTKAKAPESVGEVTAVPLSPEEIEVSFKAIEGQMYEVHWKGGDSNSGPIHPQFNSTQRIKTTISRLHPNTKYEVWVRVYSKDRLLHDNSPQAAVITFPELPHIKLENSTAHTLSISWKAPSDNSVFRHNFQYIALGDTRWKELGVEQTTAGQTYLINITKLVPATSYILRLEVVYNNTLHSYSWPKQPLFNFSTLGEIPGKPGQVMRQQVGGMSVGSSLRLWWSEAKPNGAPVIAYTLQAALYNADDLDDNITYATVYNGSDNYWLITGLEAQSSYIFRARAINKLGAGPWGEKNVIDTVVGPTMLTQTGLPTILASTIPTSLIFFGVLFTCLIYGMKRAERRRRKVKAASLNDSAHHHHHHHHPRSREVELATLRQLPTNNNFVTENNVLYNLHTFPGDDVDLPHVSRHCITLTKFLGCGAFGEVFEGTACGLPCLPEVTKVAIKTLRKGATEGEKAEFLKEAQLMSHFQHEHILRLLAVCTDHDPFFLILELMEGGDLLSYLRTSRGAECSLTLSDLVAMCLDVAKGCVYLEEMHYVHRDLAARNCLVSTTDPELRIVKIGDFGLARDIYKNDYYRKEGEGLLPVRWLSPESLVDGVFTSHSDVWAFGVLLWEILTLGQQPYPARTNLEVLHYVRSGGRLNRPPNCPEELHKLMERCWSYSPENRPTFKECLRALLMLEETISALPALAVHNVHYIGSNGDCGLDNLAYAEDRDENHNTNSGNSLVSGNDCSPSNSWSDQTSSSAVNLGGKSASQEDAGNGAEIEECDSFSGASTLPLTAPLRRHQQYLQLVNEPSPSSPPVSPRSPPVNLPLGSAAASGLPRFPPPTSSDVPQSPSNFITTAQVSIPSTPLSPSLSSPTPDSPTSVTFTFPLPTMSNVMSPQHYLKPSNNKVYTGPSLQVSSYENEGQDNETDSNCNPLVDNSYVNMSAGVDLKQACDLSGSNDFGKINGVNLRHKRDCDIITELDNHRLSGVSALSAVSGMTSASTVDLDHNSSQSWC
ncbi:proto-oncogene tyrosine-protein kinase ROS isoform X2 [Procambarus clarkii]|uniref:proto-oncogene tyrosine-protein kinase ROS isoform X2 n=1 Tax=Procambarus clarkii TaxID=6728 RepID=UPI001E670CFF|nr:proto-oncogene tyrosine-protein kinase ROS-like isoform X2 [Procambarus clarkii]